MLIVYVFVRDCQFFCGSAMRREVQDFLGEAVGREAISFFDANKLTNRRSLFFYDTVHIMSGHWKEDGEALEIAYKV